MDEEVGGCPWSIDMEWCMSLGLSVTVMSLEGASLAVPSDMAPCLTGGGVRSGEDWFLEAVPGNCSEER